MLNSVFKLRISHFSFRVTKKKKGNKRLEETLCIMKHKYPLLELANHHYLTLFSSF